MREPAATLPPTTETRPDPPDESFDIKSAVARGAFAYAVLVGAMLALGGLGALFVFDSGIGEWETDVVQRFSDNRNTALDTVAKVGTITDTWTAIGVMFGAMTILVAIRQSRLAVFIIVAMGLELATFLLVGAIIDRPRPEVEAASALPSTPSFPSGHAAGTVALYGSLMFAALQTSVRGRVGRGFAVTFTVVAALLVAASRVYDGVHYPSDVIAGLLMGTAALGAALYVTGLTGAFRDEFSSETRTDRAVQ